MQVYELGECFVNGLTPEDRDHLERQADPEDAVHMDDWLEIIQLTQQGFLDLDNFFSTHQNREGL